MKPAVYWKTLQVALLTITICFCLGATDAGSRFEDLGRKLMCTCGCAQLLGGCDHAGCPNRGEEDQELRSGIASNQTDQQIFDSFVVKYGAVVLAAPTTHGFDLVAWIAPFAVFAAASLGTILLVRRWSIRKVQVAETNIPIDDAERERREQIRRETGDGGF